MLACAQTSCGQTKHIRIGREYLYSSGFLKFHSVSSGSLHYFLDTLRIRTIAYAHFGWGLGPETKP